MSVLLALHRGKQAFKGLKGLLAHKGLKAWMAHLVHQECRAGEEKGLSTCNLVMLWIDCLIVTQGPSGFAGDNGQNGLPVSVCVCVCAVCVTLRISIGQGDLGERGFRGLPGLDGVSVSVHVMAYLA